MIENNNWVKEILKEKGLALIGFADLSQIDCKIRKGLEYGICISIAIDPDIILKIIPGPSIEYYNAYDDINNKLKLITDMLTERIIERGFKAYPLGYEKQNEYFRTTIPYKTLATRSGIGWIGKSATLVTKEYGNAIRLRGVLTNMPIETGTPMDSSLCGNCSICVKNCPAKAIKGKLWDIKIDRDELLNPYECKKTVIERGKIFNITVGSCGICIASCPWTQKYIDRKKIQDKL
jgi:epoxyqueuosine reductase QueG